MRPDNNNALAVWNVLRAHKGKANAITQNDLASLAGVRPRCARGIVKRLIEEDRRMICSSYQGNGGYFIPNTAEEIADTRRLLKSHALSILKRCSALGVDINELQMELFGEANANN